MWIPGRLRRESTERAQSSISPHSLALLRTSQQTHRARGVGGGVETGILDAVGVLARAFPGLDEDFNTYHSEGPLLLKQNYFLL